MPTLVPHVRTVVLDIPFFMVNATLVIITVWVGMEVVVLAATQTTFSVLYVYRQVYYAS